MKETLYIAVLLILTLNTSGQEDDYIFGKLSDWERSLIKYEKDSDAEAVVLFDIGETRFVRSDDGLVLEFDRTRRIKVLSTAGISYAEVEIPLYQEGNIYEKVTELEAMTHNFDNGTHTIKKVDPKTCYTEKINDSWANMKFAFPEVKVGSIIEYKYTLKSEYIFNLRDWEFQSQIPTVYSEYVTRLVPFYEFRYIVQGVNKEFKPESKVDKGIPRNFGGLKFNDMVHKFVVRDIPAFRIEEYISTPNDYIMKIDFQLAKITQLSGAEIKIMTTWPELVKDLLKNQSFGRFINKCESGADKLIDLETLEGKTELDKIKYITKSIKDNYSWNGVYGKYANSSYKELLKNKRGNSGDINLMLVGILRASGIDANPVILSTRNHGKVNVDYPFSHSLNYVVSQIYINDRIILIDATEPLTDYDLLPTRCINDRGLIIKKDNPEWLRITYSKPSREQIIINTQFDNELEKFTSKIKIIAHSYDALRMRNNFGTDTDKVSEYYDSDLLKTSKDSIHIINFFEKDLPLIFELTQIGETEIIGNKIYISPFLDMVRKENPFKYSSRTYPIEMIYPYTEVYSTKIKIPEGYELDYLPESVEYDNSLYGLDYNVLSDKESVSISFGFSFKKDTYPSSDYLRLKSHFKRIIECGEEKVVFRVKEIVNE